MAKKLEQWLDEFVENGVSPEDVTLWPQNAGGTSGLVSDGGIGAIEVGRTDAYGPEGVHVLKINKEGIKQLLTDLFNYTENTTVPENTTSGPMPLFAVNGHFSNNGAIPKASYTAPGAIFLWDSGFIIGFDYQSYYDVDEVIIGNWEIEVVANKTKIFDLIDLLPDTVDMNTGPHTYLTWQGTYPYTTEIETYDDYRQIYVLGFNGHSKTIY